MRAGASLAALALVALAAVAAAAFMWTQRRKRDTPASPHLAPPPPYPPFAGLLGWPGGGDDPRSKNAQALAVVGAVTAPSDWEAAGAALGGWCMGADCRSGNWKSDGLGNAICPGSFQADIQTDTGAYGTAEILAYRHRLYTIGGQGVGADSPDLVLNTEYVAAAVDDIDATGVLLDYEGALSRFSVPHMIAFVDNLRDIMQRPLNAVFCFQPNNESELHTVIEKIPPPTAGSANRGFTHLCPMLYTNDNSYPSYDVQRVLEDVMLPALRTIGWERDRIFLTFSVDSMLNAADVGADVVRRLARLATGQAATFASA